MIDSFKETVNYVPRDMPWVVWQKSWLLRYSQIFLEKNFISFIFLLLLKIIELNIRKIKKTRK